MEQKFTLYHFAEIDKNDPHNTVIFNDPETCVVYSTIDGAMTALKKMFEKVKAEGKNPVWDGREMFRYGTNHVYSILYWPISKYY